MMQFVVLSTVVVVFILGTSIPLLWSRAGADQGSQQLEQEYRPLQHHRTEQQLGYGYSAVLIYRVQGLSLMKNYFWGYQSHLF